MASLKIMQLEEEEEIKVLVEAILVENEDMHNLKKIGTIDMVEGLYRLKMLPFKPLKKYGKRNWKLILDSHKDIFDERTEIGGTRIDMRSKSRTISKPVEDPSKLPKWNYDGSSTGQAPGDDNEVILYPQAIFKDPFRGGNNILVICDSYTPQGEPIPTNKRHRAAEIFSNPKVQVEVPWYI
eukprot:XP_025983909.1 glutamine synthetase leaf isozyme, chloroplastic-like [Glycine max]